VFGGVMVGMLAASAVDHGFQPRLGQIKDYEIGICHDEFRFVLDQHALLDLYSASSPKQQSEDRHVAPL
jgi:hypothetical protein